MLVVLTEAVDEEVVRLGVLTEVELSLLSPLSPVSPVFSHSRPRQGVLATGALVVEPESLPEVVVPELVPLSEPESFKSNDGVEATSRTLPEVVDSYV